MKLKDRIDIAKWKVEYRFSSWTLRNGIRKAKPEEYVIEYGRDIEFKVDKDS